MSKISVISLVCVIASLTALSTTGPSWVLQASADTPEVARASSRCASVEASVAEAGFSDSVSVVCDHDFALIHADTFPQHELMNGIVNSNEQVPIPAKDYVAPIPLQSALSDQALTRDAALAIAVNGVPIFDYTGGGEMSQADLHHAQTQHDTLLTEQLDHCGGHAGRGDDYHYHVSPKCMIEQMENKGDDAILGWAFDGFPLYGNNNPDGTPISANTLDVCNGQPDDTYGYRYHTSADSPYIIQCLRGEVASPKSLPRVAPLRRASDKKPMAARRPPRGGVEELLFTPLGAGAFSMDYSHEGERFYIRYTPTNTAHCYRLETRTVSDRGTVKTDEYCR